MNESTISAGSKNSNEQPSLKKGFFDAPSVDNSPMEGDDLTRPIKLVRGSASAEDLAQIAKNLQTLKQEMDDLTRNEYADKQREFDAIDDKKDNK